MASTKRIARLVPDGIVTFCGFGGSGGGAGAAGAAACATSVVETGFGFGRPALGRAFGAGAGAGAGFSSICAGGSVSATGEGVGAATCRLLITSFTPGTAAAWRAAASRCISLSTAPVSVTVPLAACTFRDFADNPESWLNLV